MGLLDNFVVKIYRDDVFIGFVRSYRKHRNGLYLFEKTKNLNNALIFNDLISSLYCETHLKDELDKIYYFNKNNYFKTIKIDSQDIRLSNLNILRNRKIKLGILKNKEL